MIFLDGSGVLGRNDHIVGGQPNGTFYTGSWPINNKVMYKALEYAGLRREAGPGRRGTQHATWRRDHARGYELPTEGGKVFRREVKRKDVTAWAPVKPPRPPL